MIKELPNWKMNEHGDGILPVCPYCKTEYGDGDIFEVKNYPADGGAMMFFECVECKKEAKIDFDWVKIRKVTID